MQDIAGIRKEYQLQTLSETEVEINPIDQFSRWWADALKSDIDEVNAMTLATAGKNGVPSARIVLLKEFSEKGFVFFTNYGSDKGREMEENPQACLVFFWKELERQVRITGSVHKISSSESDEYFASRPEGSRLGAWASPQSSVIDSREVIEVRLSEYEHKFAGGSISRPPHWGGYSVSPAVVEFWQGRPNRLHDRIRYRLQGDKSWKIERLAP